jgi:hypothetical protein
MNHSVLVTVLLTGVSGVVVWRAGTSLSRGDSSAGDPAGARRRERAGGLTAV